MSSVRTGKIPFVERDNIGEAYLNSLNFLANNGISYPYLIVHILRAPERLDKCFDEV